jgi:hypothetical protein
VQTEASVSNKKACNCGNTGDYDIQDTVMQYEGHCEVGIEKRIKCGTALRAVWKEET